MSSGLLLLLLLALSHLLGPVHCGGGDTEPTPPPIELHPSNLAAAAAESAYSSFEPASLDLVLAYATADNETYVKDLFELVSIPSISALPDHAQDVLSAAEWLKKRMMVAGLENVQVLSTEGPQPVVYADWLHAGRDKPIVMAYCHYDVQPVDPLDLWQSPPFVPEERDGLFFGRGIDDDKSGCLQVIHAVEAYMTAVSTLPVNIKFLFEGQEEIGSPNLPNFLNSHSQGLLSGVDLVLNADGGQPFAHQPGICTGLRGAAALEVTVETAGADMHSGMKGGSVQNANHALIQLLSGLWDRPSQNVDPVTKLLNKILGKGTGRVTVPGFYDQVRAMTASDKADVAAFPFNEEQEQAALGVLGFMGESGFNTLERRWYRPTLEIVGMSGGFTGQGMKTVIPRTASAKISLRLVPHMTPDYVTAKVKAHLEASAPPNTNVTVQILGFKANPWVSLKDTPGNKLAAEVLEKVYSVRPVYYRDGGTIPALAYFQSILGVNTTGFGFGLGDHIHAPNERTPALQYHTGRVAWVEMLAVLGQKWPTVPGSDPATTTTRSRSSSSSGSSSSSSIGDDFEYDSEDKQEL